MKPEDNPHDSESPIEESPNEESEDIFQAEVVDEIEAGSSDEESEGKSNSRLSAGLVTTQSKVPPRAKHPGEQLWSSKSDSLKLVPKPPFGKEMWTAKFVFGISAVFSLAFLIWFYASELQLVQRKPLGVFRDSLLIIFVLLGNLVGFFRVQRLYVPSDSRWLAWVCTIIAAACFFSLLPARWSWVSFTWILFQLAPAIANAFAPQKVEGEDMQFNVNDSVAANGGSIASIVLGLWSILGALFTSLSIVNSLLGIVMGLWGLGSRKKGLAVLGIALCVVGTLACMLNITYLFWEIISLEEEELLQSAQ